MLRSQYAPCFGGPLGSRPHQSRAAHQDLRSARAWSWGVRRLSRLAPRVSRRAPHGKGQR